MADAVVGRHEVRSEDAALVAKAVMRAGEALGLKQSEIAEIIGVSATTASRMKQAGTGPSGKSYELALYLIRVFGSLDAITGGDRQTIQSWMRNQNTDLREVPSEALKSVDGLVAVMSYLDAARGPI